MHPQTISQALALPAPTSVRDRSGDARFELLGRHQLLIRQPPGNKPRTTFSNHWLRKYPNQVLVSDTTYLLIGSGFWHLFLLTDAYSRKIIGYALEATLAAEGAVKAMRIGILASVAYQA